jgi:molecular chaperone DnaK
VLESQRDPSKPDELRAAFESLQTMTHKLAESLYKNAGPSPEGGPSGGEQAGASAGGGGGGGDVIDAEFEDKT